MDTDTTIHRPRFRRRIDPVDGTLNLLVHGAYLRRRTHTAWALYMAGDWVADKPKGLRLSHKVGHALLARGLIVKKNSHPLIYVASAAGRKLVEGRLRSQAALDAARMRARKGWN